MGESVVFTGTLTTQTRAQATDEAQERGYAVSNKMTKATQILVCGDRMGATKTNEAKKWGVLVLSEAEWRARLDAEAASSPPAAKSAATKAKEKKRSSDSHPAATASKKQATATDDGDAEYDETTGAIGGIAPKVLLDDGTFQDVQSASSSSTYVVKRLGRVYTCNCPAWRNQKAAPTVRTCKHLKQLLGDEFEAVRVGTSVSGSSTRGGSSKASGSKAAVVKATAPKVLLANKWDREKNDPVDWWISEKLDGVRAYWDASKRVFLSRLGNVYPAPDWFTANFPSDVDLDGELFGGRGCFQFTVGIAKTDGSKHWDQLVYKVFDAPSLSKLTFEARMKRAQTIVKDASSKHMEWVEHTQCTSMEHLDEVFDEIEKLGGEGLMIRQPESLYAQGRSSSLLKIKSFHDGEAVVIAHEDGKGKYVGMCGALRCKMASGKMFKVASGLSDEQRGDPPSVGTIIVYKCQELTNDGIPRFPVFLGVAADKTCAKDPVIANAVGRE